MATTPHYPTEGAAFHAQTGRTVRQAVIEDGVADPTHHTAVSLLATYIGNTCGGGRPSDFARSAVSIYRRGGIEAVQAYLEGVRTGR